MILQRGWTQGRPQTGADTFSVLFQLWLYILNILALSVCGNASEDSGEEGGGISMPLQQLPQLSGETLELEPWDGTFSTTNLSWPTSVAGLFDSFWGKKDNQIGNHDIHSLEGKFLLPSHLAGHFSFLFKSGLDFLSILGHQNIASYYQRSHHRLHIWIKPALMIKTWAAMSRSAPEFVLYFLALR